jgi:hypothetical protein
LGAGCAVSRGGRAAAGSCGTGTLASCDGDQPHACGSDDSLMHEVASAVMAYGGGLNGEDVWWWRCR